MLKAPLVLRSIAPVNSRGDAHEPLILPRYKLRKVLPKFLSELLLSDLSDLDYLCSLHVRVRG